jgi:hypothetical protein
MVEVTGRVPCEGNMMCLVRVSELSVLEAMKNKYPEDSEIFKLICELRDCLLKTMGR